MTLTNNIIATARRSSCARKQIFATMSRIRGGQFSRQKGRSLRVLVDMDGVLCQFEEYFLQQFREKFPDEPYVPLEERNTFYLNDQYKSLDSLEGDITEKVSTIWQSEGFFKNLPPIEGAVDAIKEISGMDNVEVFICTSPLTGSNIDEHFSAKEKFEWVGQFLGKDWVKRMVVTNDKTIVNGDILIDDKPHIKGIETQPVWDQILFTSCHNKDIDISKFKIASRLENWTDKNGWKSLIEEYKKKIA